MESEAKRVTKRLRHPGSTFVTGLMRCVSLQITTHSRIIDTMYPVTTKLLGLKIPDSKFLAVSLGPPTKPLVVWYCGTNLRLLVFVQLTLQICRRPYLLICWPLMEGCFRCPSFVSNSNFNC